jgi:glucose-6-phosphate isomerase
MFGEDPEATAWFGPESDAAFRAALARCEEARAAERIGRGDHTLWKDDPTEIVNRLGWLRSPESMRGELARIATFVEEVRAEGVTDVLLLGMGGSSLAPELFATTFAPPPGSPRVRILDSTDPAAVLDAERGIDPGRTLCLVSTKSGGTVETLSFFKYFYGLLCARLGPAGAGRRFAVITDPGSSLERSARAIGARAIFLNDPEIGGRFSALSSFGLVPAALGGVDTAQILERAGAMAQRCRRGAAAANPGVALGAALGGLALTGRDKATLVLGPEIRAFGPWIEQLVAESTGKEGRGILPVEGEPLGASAVYGDDRLFVFILLEGDTEHEPDIARLAGDGHPVLRFVLRDARDLGGEFFRWELATAVAGFLLGVNPFDQPDVESAKVQANRALAAYREQGSLPQETLTGIDAGLGFSGDVRGADAAAVLEGFLDRGRPGDYVAVQAYLPPDAAVAEALGAIRLAVRDRWGHAVTAAFGPRFLHSTGQLHKGGANTGLFLQLTADPAEDVAIPDRLGEREGSVTFGVLEAAQSLGDRTALAAAGRRVLRVHLGRDPRGGLATLLRLLGRR